PAAGATGVGLYAPVTATFSDALDPASVNASTFELRNAANAVVAASLSYDAATRTATLTPSAGLAPSTTYTATLRGGASDPRIKDLAGNPLASSVSWSFTTVSGSEVQTCPCSGWPSTASPTNPSVNDPGALELGVKFRVDVDGFITGVRFYKGANNTGTHIGNLWSLDGTRLATAQFGPETASGWQQVNFATPVSVKANTVYVASYFAPNGGYAGDNNFFASTGVNRAPVHLLQSGESGGNGVYAYGSSSTFPTESYLATNYWVDVLFSPATPADTTAPTVSSTVPANAATGVSTTAAVTATFSEALDAATVTGSTFELRSTTGGALVNAAVAYNAATRTATLTPAAALAASTSYTATLKGGSSVPVIKDQAGNALAGNVQWSFTTAAPADTTAPTSSITSPAAGASVPAAAELSITGTASDVGGTVSKVEVSTDGGGSWQTATGTTSWRFAWMPSTEGSATILSRAVDDSGNVQSPPASRTVTVIAANCPCSAWPASAAPTRASDPDTRVVNVGVKFRSSVAGYITGIRFYKGTGNTGTHIGALWSSTGTLLASATFVNETATGWQQVNFAKPVPIAANTVYVASYRAPRGHYASDELYFDQRGVDAGPLHLLRRGESGGNGVYIYGGTAPKFPTSTYRATNYWVDVVFQLTP
ncbi:DUF4082 domain-containing protein, partial [Azohydromonas caseinilytica]